MTTHRTDAHPHSAVNPAAFLAEDAATQAAKLDELIASVPLPQRPAVLAAYTLGRSSAALPFFAQGFEAGQAMQRDTPELATVGRAPLRLIQGGVA